MGKYIDITGQKFGLLTALNVDHKTKWDEHWFCQCDCGNKVTRSKSDYEKVYQFLADVKSIGRFLRV